MRIWKDRPATRTVVYNDEVADTRPETDKSRDVVIVGQHAGDLIFSCMLAIKNKIDFFRRSYAARSVLMAILRKTLDRWTSWNRGTSCNGGTS